MSQSKRDRKKSKASKYDLTVKEMLIHNFLALLR